MRKSLPYLTYILQSLGLGLWLGIGYHIQKYVIVLMVRVKVKQRLPYIKIYSIIIRVRVMNNFSNIIDWLMNVK